MPFAAAPLLPAISSFEAYLTAIRQYVRTACRVTPERVLKSFFGFQVSPRQHRIGRLHHVALYIGDYEAETDWEAWREFLSRNAGVRRLSWGPSYIAPRIYQTPGYWINCTLNGRSVEMFSNKSSGEWRDMHPTYKIHRMSHFALSVPRAIHLRALLTYWAHYQDISLLSFSPIDKLGHTYGHLLNRKTNEVLELTHQSSIRQVTLAPTRISETPSPPQGHRPPSRGGFLGR
jgi:hypothetical protein